MMMRVSLPSLIVKVSGDARISLARNHCNTHVENDCMNAWCGVPFCGITTSSALDYKELYHTRVTGIIMWCDAQNEVYSRVSTLAHV